jgi:hypothetical protein
MNKLRRYALYFAAWSLLLSMVGVAGEDKPQPPGAPSGNAFSRIIRGNYETPAVTGFDLRGDATLDAMIRDGKLPLSAEDAVRLALENNVDINVERYNPYFSLYGIQQGKAVLNPSVLFSTNVNRTVTPAASALQGAPTVFNISTLYTLAVHKPFEPSLDVDVNFNTARARTNSI